LFPSTSGQSLGSTTNHFIGYLKSTHSVFYDIFLMIRTNLLIV
jgi:hypothetical protein